MQQTVYCITFGIGTVKATFARAIFTEINSCETLLKFIIGQNN